ncbi:amidohydrolase family protein [Pseudomonadota bacterium]
MDVRESHKRVWTDAEVHLLPPQWCRADYTPPAGEDVLMRVVYNHPERENALSRATAEAALEEMNRAGIECSVIMGLPWRAPEMNWLNNDYIREVVEMYPGRFIGMGMTPPPDLEDPRDAVRKISDEYGFPGVKVIPSWQGFSLDDPIFAPALEEMVDRNLVLEPHTDHGFMSPTKYDSVHSLFEVAKRYPELRILAPHLGGLLCLYSLHAPMKDVLKNITFVGSVPTSLKMIEFAVAAVGADRVTFGSDFPFNPSHDQCSLIDTVEGLNLMEEEKDMLAHGTFKTFFGLT